MHRWIIGACVFYVAGVAVYYGFINTTFVSLELEPYFNDSHTFTVQVDSYPDISDSGVKFVTRIIELNSETEFKNRLLVRMQGGELMNAGTDRVRLEYGDVLEMTGIIEQPESFVGDAGRTFNYPAYLATDGIYGIIEPKQVTWLRNDAHTLIRVLYRMRTWFVDRLGDYFNGNEHGLLAGMLIGEKSRLSKELATDFQVVGLSHIVVLSGYNITLVVSAVMYIAQWCGLGYRGRRVIAAAVVPPFVIMTGAGASSVRAGMMSVMQLMLQIDTRNARAYLIVLYTLTLIVVSSPVSLVHSPSLHLSFLAFVGLVYVVPIMKSFKWVENALRKCESYTVTHIVSNLIVETTSVQLFVLPYIIYMSGTFSVISLAVNIVVVPLVSWIMLGGVVVVVLSVANSFTAELLALPVERLLRYIIYMSEWGASIGVAQLIFDPISVGLLGAVYTLAGLLIVWWHTNKKEETCNK